jgi:V8-like Glu-specific endopeptidase
MRTKPFQTIAFLVLLFLPAAVWGQISRGGFPIQIEKLKSLSPDEDLVVMPPVDNLKMKSLYSLPDRNRLKPLHFAEPFQVSLTPENSGKWYSDGAFNIWQLRIFSKGAYSLNLILNRFEIPDGARLFLVGLKSGVVKGAYTSDNMAPGGVFAIEPVAGDELLVQYEEPVKPAFKGDFVIAQVAHDFIGAGADGDHRPLGVSGSCNVNVNCDLVNGSSEIRDAVCRILVEGTELCSGTLVNNTSLDGTPYLLTAYHCFVDEYQKKTPEELAHATVYLFNYESPGCESVDGDVSRSVSGSAMKASYDSLDFALVQLNSQPPNYFRPYLAGWNIKNVTPTRSFCIHHPLGDIKKIAVDSDQPVTASFNSDYKSNAFWKVLRWDEGVTEDGSSGAALLDQNAQLVGALTGGSANCSFPTNDYFGKLALSWNYKSEFNKQLKHWLDPLNSGQETLAGKYLYNDENLCVATSNIVSSDNAYLAPPILVGQIKKGYWTGSNSAGYTEFAEQYNFAENSVVQGITLGVAKVKTSPLNSTHNVTIAVYSGTTAGPVTKLYSQTYPISSLYAGAMNYLPFRSPVQTKGVFYVSYDVSGLQKGDTLAFYMTNRISGPNTFFLKNDGGWHAYNTQNLNYYGSLLTELIACNVSGPLITPPSADQANAQFYPNPLNGNVWLNVRATRAIDCPDEIDVFDLLGRKLNVKVEQLDSSNVRVNFSGQKAGVYFVRLDTKGHTVIGKVSYVP